MRRARRPGRWLLWAVAGAVTVGVVAAACGGSSSDSAVRDIEEILEGPIQITDLTDSGAVVRVDTTVAVVCSVVYGTDTSYGSQSTDLDMAGTGIRRMRRGCGGYCQIRRTTTDCRERRRMGRFSRVRI